MRLWIILTMWLLVGCSVPDGGDWGRLTESLQKMIPEQREQARRWQANQNAIKNLEETGPDHELDIPFMYVACKELDVDPTEVTRGYYTFTMRDVLQCLHAGAGDDQGNITYRECVQSLFDGAKRLFTDKTGLKPECRRFYDPRWGYENNPFPMPEWEPENIDDEDIARGLVESGAPPKWVYGVVAVGAAVGVAILAPELLPILCALGTDWGCPDSPLYPPGQTPQPDQGEP